jgi:hypothetical protein
MKTNVKSYTANQLLARVKSLPNFKSIPSEYWILGVRSNEDEENKFDDKFYIFKGEDFILVTSGTTNPGSPSLRMTSKNQNKAGSFIVRSDMWHYDVWKVGKHRAKMDALVQNKEIFGFRDSNKDGKVDEEGKLFSGFFGINFHASTYIAGNKTIQENIGEWSHGCQVVNNRVIYDRIITFMRPQKVVTYCLLKEF